MRSVHIPFASFAMALALMGAKPVVETSTRVDHTALDTVLAVHVRADGVDYRGLRERSSRTLGRYLDAMAQVDAASLTPRERNAYEINLYNATMLRAVCDRLAPDWTPAAEEFAVFKAPLVRLRNRTLSLNQFENDVIRPRMKDPRVHAALNCAARSCPPLAARAYRAADLDSMLEANMMRFLRDSRRNAVDSAARRMRLSRLFEWYAADFGGPVAVPGYVAKRLALQPMGWSVEYLEYDWSLALSATPKAR